MTDHPCPTCSNGEITALVDGPSFQGVRTIKCWRCGGSMRISAETARKIAEGKKMRAERIARGVSIMTEAKTRGITPAELSAIENGRA
jgi:hypothetical protein